MDLYIGINGTAKKVKKMYIGVNNIAKEVKLLYYGNENNTAVQTYRDYNNFDVNYFLAYQSNQSDINVLTIPNDLNIISSYMFSHCENIKELNIPSTVTSIKDHAFEYCTKLQNITINDNVTELKNNAFEFCTTLHNITLPNTITIIDRSLFKDCSSLTNITIPDTVTSLEAYSFYNTALNIITIPENITNIGNAALSNCSQLTTLILKPVTPPTLNARSFDNTSFTAIYVPISALSTYQTADVWSDYKDIIYKNTAKLSFTNIDENTQIFDNNNNAVTQVYCDGLEYFFYNKDWGMTTYTTTLIEDYDQSYSEELPIPTEYNTITYTGLSDDIKNDIQKITITYNNVSFKYTSLPINIAIPLGSIDVTINIIFNSYTNISQTTTVTTSQNIILSDPSIKTISVIDYNNAEYYSTLVDNNNFIIKEYTNNLYLIQNGPASYNVNNGHSKGYITFKTSDTISDSCNCVSIYCAIRSETNYDIGYAYLCPGSSPIYPSSNSILQDITASTTTDGYIIKKSGSDSSFTTCQSGILSPNTIYTLSIGYYKNANSNFNDDKFYIYSIKFPGVVVK